MRILIIEDEKKVAGFLKNGLREEGYAVDDAFDGQAGFDLAVENEYDIIHCPDADVINALYKHKEFFKKRPKFIYANLSV